MGGWANISSNKYKYIIEVLEGTIDLRKKKSAEINEMLETKQYDKIDNYEPSYILEFLNRQCNYVINMQHSYDFLELDWRVPLWDDDLIEFWLSTDFKMKSNQFLYTKILLDNNWSNLFNSIPIPIPMVQPCCDADDDEEDDGDGG